MKFYSQNYSIISSTPNSNSYSSLPVFRMADFSYEKGEQETRYDIHVHDGKAYGLMMVIFLVACRCMCCFILYNIIIEVSG